MIFSTAEIEILRLAGWFKGVPLELCRMDDGLFSTAGTRSLRLYKLLYVTKNELYLKLTPAGWSLLEQLGYHYPQDACYITDPQKLARRNEAAKLMFTSYRAGIDIFADTPDQIARTPVFLSSIAARRNPEFTGSKVWAGCRMAGIVQLLDTAYVLHYMDGQGLMFQNEMNLFHKRAPQWPQKILPVSKVLPLVLSGIWLSLWSALRCAMIFCVKLKVCWSIIFSFGMTEDLRSPFFKTPR